MAGMTWTGFPRSLNEAMERLAQHEAQTGYKTLALAVDTRLMPNYGDGGGAHVAEGERNIVTYYLDGRIKINTLGSRSQGRVARINAALPLPYQIRRRVRGFGWELLRGKAVAETFNLSLIFTPEAHGATVAA